MRAALAILLLFTAAYVSASCPIAIGSRVVTTELILVMSKPSYTRPSKTRGPQTAGSAGTVICGPGFGSGYKWWNVDFDSGPDGWVVVNKLRLE